MGDALEPHYVEIELALDPCSQAARLGVSVAVVRNCIVSISELHFFISCYFV